MKLLNSEGFIIFSNFFKFITNVNVALNIVPIYVYFRIPGF